MSRDRTRVRSRLARRLLVPGVLVPGVLGALAVAVVPAGPTASADEGGGVDGSTASLCPPAVARLLGDAADRFVAGCGDTGASAVASAAVPPGRTAMSDNMELLATVPRQGELAGAGDFGTDLAFQGDYAYAGNYGGLSIYDISTPSAPELVKQVVCPGAQNDVSVTGDLLVLSVDESRSNDSCRSRPASTTSRGSWEGIRVFDISDPTEPDYVAAVRTACGSHTHTLAPSARGRTVFVYVSSFGPARTFPGCKPPHDRISVVRVPIADPASAKLVSTPVLFPRGGNRRGGYSSFTSGCHDITAYPAKDLAAGACMGDGVLLDISDRRRPVVTERVRDRRNFAFWHSATFNDTGTKVVFTDELGGGGAATCNPRVGPRRGADAIYRLTQRGQLRFASYYKIPRSNSRTENCVAHNGSLVPVQGRDVMVQAWYQGGISVWDFTDARRPTEIGWFDRGAISEDRFVLGGSWSAYWYRGHIYSNDIREGLDVLRIVDKRLTPLAPQGPVAFNPQSQPSFNG